MAHLQRSKKRHEIAHQDPDHVMPRAHHPPRVEEFCRSLRGIEPIASPNFYPCKPSLLEELCHLWVCVGRALQVQVDEEEKQSEDRNQHQLHEDRVDCHCRAVKE
eukprot:CAMPEP_0114660914 /NCGR_PEP_ID=MMETSP0191-20121206/21253_1 /TAXON_ID=126664 /ORGANISM="Sorites sp." /LENGTH=104 /DNA_ID=CAMNT_0001891471 /DNA_START=740 /DNA_END=1054 /DNA_ORIENTATION=-